MEVRGAELPGAGVFVAFEHLLIGDALIAAHDDCDDAAQTLRVAPPPTTSTSTAPHRIAPTMPRRTRDIDGTHDPSTTATTTTSTTALPAPIVTTPGPNSLPRTGSDRAQDVATAALAMSMIGAGLLLLARRRRDVRGS